MDDAGQEVPAEWFEEAVSWIESALAADPDAVVLTHCHMGINRGPSANTWYAADALRWHHDRTGTEPDTAADEHAALQSWREAHPLDVVRLVRQGWTPAPPDPTHARSAALQDDRIRQRG
ncbi:MAG: hypothetical protein Q8R60_19060 [Mycobacteriales bacterium]|nr:hypothetical protein [Mycobacteriales bacterium]